MSMDRMQFLKIAGISSILGLGATAASATHNVSIKGIKPPQVEPNKEGLKAEHWAMVVDMSKFKTEEDFQKTISAATPQICSNLAIGRRQVTEPVPSDEPMLKLSMEPGVTLVDLCVSRNTTLRYGTSQNRSM